MTRRNAWIAGLAVMAGIGGLIVARPAVSVDAQSDGRQAPPAALSDGRGDRSGRGPIAGPGRVEPLSEEVDISSELSGKLSAVLVDEGATVAAGDVIARLERREYEARVASTAARLAVARAERLRLVNGARPEERREADAVAGQAAASLVLARQDVDRERLLFADQVIAKDALDRAERDWQMADARQRETAERAAAVRAEARADEMARADAAVALAEANLAEARAMLDKTEVRAPFAGVILRRHRQSGESVSLDGPSPAIVTMADARVLRVRVEVDERDVAGLRVGQPAYVTAGAFGAERFAGRVVRVGQMLGRKKIRTDEPTERVDTKVLETLVELNTGTRLPIGLRVDAFIER